MRSSTLPLAILCLLLSAAGAGRAADSPRTRRIGVLFWHSSPSDAKAFRGVREGFELTGIPHRFEELNAREDAGKARAAVKRWEAEGFDLIYALGTSAALRAKEATKRIPVVFTAVTNPFGSGVVDSWSGSGTNLCGNSNWIDTSDVLQVFQLTVRGLAKLGVVYNPSNPVSLEEIAEARRLFREQPERRLRLIEAGIHGPKDLKDAVNQVIKRGAEALWIPIDHDVYQHLDVVDSITRPKRIPLLASQESAARTRALVGVTVDYRALGRRSVIFAKRVLLDGADPGKLPVGRLRSYRVIANLAAARRMGLRLPLRLLARADEILFAFEEDRR